MLKYHILYKENASDFISKGVNVEGENEIVALGNWRQQFPDAIFLGLMSQELMGLMRK